LYKNLLHKSEFGEAHYVGRLVTAAFWWRAALTVGGGLGEGGPATRGGGEGGCWWRVGAQKHGGAGIENQVVTGGGAPLKGTTGR
jgi:hypothetical protein